MKKISIILWLFIIFMVDSGDTLMSCATAVSEQNKKIWLADKIDTTNADFSYRTVYSFSNQSKEASAMYGMGNLDYDWGIWGHNLSKVLPKKNVNKAVFATINGYKSENQFCFSSNELYNYTVNFIIDNYGEDMPMRFVIMPNDDTHACTCERCLTAGNTEKNATPAVTMFVEQLARRFPKHFFLTSYYYSTAHIPSHRLPENVGVMISAINFPLVQNAAKSKQGIQFANLLDRWSEKTSHIYIWDYCRNFDDYLTIFPCLSIMQERLKMYKAHNVDGIIFNGSGNIYSTFDDLETYVLARLMVNVDENIDRLVDHFLKLNYPNTHSILSKNYLEMDHRVKKLDIYSGMDFAADNYISRDYFYMFVDELEKASKSVKGAERQRLNYCLTGLNFSRLELMRLTNSPNLTKNKEVFLDNLKGHNELEGMNEFREANGNIDDYIAYMRSNTHFDIPKNNALAGKELIPKSSFDEDSKSISVLTDGYRGIPMDYHQAWLLYSSDTLHLEIPAMGKKPDKLVIGLLISVPWHIGGAKVYATQGGKVVLKQPEVDFDQKFHRIEVTLDVSKMLGNKPIQLYLLKTGRKIAVDEVQLLTK